ncbi:heme peroxidase [Auriscalpium vulgare]|uniref:Heme peroxidase n=1 Tax=Auriscalpium vulgare TaxID=40419 RepID=A0ACB8S4I3_9AGAM|nr:heme peroxidase [Auriscalpium vulgare]
MSPDPTKRADLDRASSSFFKSSRRPPPTSLVDTGNGRPVPALLTGHVDEIIREIEQAYEQHRPAFELSDLPSYIDAVKNMAGPGIDDRKFLLEHLLTLMSRLPADSAFAIKLQQITISVLYKDLPHPPGGYLALPPQTTEANTNTAETITYAYRSADGSNYNQLIPSLGKARSPYARTVPSKVCASPSSLPSPDLVFDALLKRDKFVEHPGGNSSLFFAFADLVIHSVFNTDHHDWTQNNASSYLDLSPLYGSSQADLDKIRRKDGTGRLYEDVFADSRLLFMPPSVCALLVLLNRNHNFIAEKILSINERGNLSNPPPQDEARRLVQDEEIFQRARLVNSGFFVQIIFGDYVGAILGLVRDGLSWRLDPLSTIRDLDHEVCPRGEGNVVSVEFNLLYRWHATLSQEDTTWTEEVFSELFEGKDPSTISVDDFKEAAHKYMIPDPDVTKWSFAKLKRDANGRFANADLARILQNATESPASAFKARGTPEVLRVIEILTIEQSRAWGVCSLNEFRQFMGLKPYSSFEEWNPNKEIAAAAEALYHDIDNLELHAGMQAEESKVPMAGAGLCPGYTISRTILADAVALTRGDRFLTTEFTPFNLTNWGYQDLQPDTNDGSYGGMLTRLLFRHLPEYYPAGSAYAHFPFMVPKSMKTYAQDLPGKAVMKYTWTRPPGPSGPDVTVGSFTDVQSVLASPAVFQTTVAQRLNVLTRGIPLDLASVRTALLEEDHIQKATASLGALTSALIERKSLPRSSSTRYVDVVRDVINVLPIHWLANDILGLPLKSAQNPTGTLEQQELYSNFADIANYVYHNAEPSEDWVLRESSRTAVDNKVIKYVKSHLQRLKNGLASVVGIRDSIQQFRSGGNENNDPFLRSVLKAAPQKENDSALDKIAESIFAELVPTAALFSQALVHVVNFFLADSRSADRAELAALLAKQTPGDDAAAMARVYEALRLDPIVSSVSLAAQSQAAVGGVNVQPGQRVVVSIIEADADSSAFPSPSQPEYNRASPPRLLGVDHKGLTSPVLFERVVPRVLHEIFKLQNLQRDAGISGVLNRFTQTLQGVPEQLYVGTKGRTTPFPTSLIVNFNA